MSLKSWTLYYEDGLWDILLGLLLISGGLRTLSGTPLAYLFTLGGVFFFIAARVKITRPRLAAAGKQESEPPKKDQRVLLILLVLTLLLTSALLLITTLGIILPQPLTGLVFILMVPIFLIYLAYLIGFTRLYGYAFLIAGFLIIIEFVSVPAGAWAQILSGLTILSVGFLVLSRFLDKPTS